MLIKNTKNKYDYLILAGDYANNNKDTGFLLNELSKHWKYIFLVWGNHDYYGSTKEDPRSLELHKKGYIPTNVYVLDYPSNSIVVNGVRIIGDMGWYDFRNHRIIEDYYNLNDSVWNKELTIDDIRDRYLSFRGIVEKEEYDICITHVPIVNIHKTDYNANGCYSLGYNAPEKDNKLFISGHTHEVGKIILNEEKQHILITNALGYNNDSFLNREFNHDNLDMNDFFHLKVTLIEKNKGDKRMKNLKAQEIQKILKNGFQTEFVSAEKAGKTVAYLKISDGRIFEGVATLKDGDIWDIHTGQVISHMKAKRKALKVLRRELLEEETRLIREWQDEVEVLIGKMDNRLDYTENYFKEKYYEKK